jgi:hypothetical protein
MNQSSSLITGIALMRALYLSLAGNHGPKVIPVPKLPANNYNLLFDAPLNHRETPVMTFIAAVAFHNF